MTAAAKPDQQHDRPKRNWLKRSGLTFLTFLLTTAIFHRPILRGLIRFAAVRVAAGQHLKLQFTLEGSPLSDLTFTNIRISPTGRSPVESLSIDEARVTYSIGGILAHGSLGFFQSCEIKNAALILDDIPDEPGEKSHLGQDMHQWFFPPVYFVGRATVENLNILGHTPAGDFILRSGNLHLKRGAPGSLQIQQMQIPTLKTWENIEGHVTLSGSDLVLEDVKLTPDITVGRLVSSPAPATGKISRMALQAKVFGGRLSGEFVNTRHDGGYDADIRVSAAKLSLDDLRKFLSSPIPLSGSVDSIEIQGGGNPDAPAAWHGSATISNDSPAGAGVFNIDHANARLVLKNGTATLGSSESSGGVNKASGEVRGQLPSSLAGFRDMALAGRFQISAPDLGRSIAALTHGSIIAEGNFNLRNNEFSSELVATGKDINSEKFDVSQADAKVSITKALGNKHPVSDFPGGVTARCTVQFKDLRIDQYALDSGTITAGTTGDRLDFSATNLVRGPNTAALRASYHFPSEGSKWAAADFDLDFSLAAENLAGFNAEPNLTGLNGQFEASGAFSRRDGLLEGQIKAAGTKFSGFDLTADSLEFGVGIEKSVATIRAFSLVMDPKNKIECEGKIGLDSPFDYNGSIQADMADLGVFNPILGTLGINERIGGALSAKWKGSGQLSRIRHTGAGEIKLTNGNYGSYRPITAEIAGAYSPESADIPTIHVAVDKTDLLAKIDLHDTEIKIHDILLRQGNVKLLQGGIALPLDLRTPANPDSLIPSGGRIFANLTSDEVNLETLLIRPKQTSPLKGLAKFSINADGTLDNFIANILVRGRNLQSKATPAVAPASLELNCDFRNNQFTLNGVVQQPAISPLQIAGSYPFSLKEFLKTKKLDEQAPIKLSVKLEKSPVTIIGQLVPGVRYIEGQMEINARAGGTIAEPVLSGVASLDLPAIRMRDPDAPAINAFKGNAEFSGNQLTINHFGGEISGGPFNIAGKILFQKLTAPVLDLRLTSQNALLVRDETVTVRANSDIRIAGIFDAAHASGTVGFTKSKFFREVEILPIELPGRPAPKPPTEKQMGFSFKPPLANWTFDVAVKTEDPFLIRGNLTNGAVQVDLKLEGTGAVPLLVGTVRTTNFVASLPFSRLNIDAGYLYFTADNPFVPTLDIRGSSSLRDYNIRVYISGTPSEPVTIFTSDPPLPQEEIIALLGTGATAQELTGRGDVLAGRAALLLLQKIYQKLFKQSHVEETNSFLTRFDLNPGTIDPTTGRQEVSARYKLTERFYLLGNIDQEGDAAGQVGYLFRFR